MTEKPAKTEKAGNSETPKILDELSKNNSANAGSRGSRQQKNARRRIVVVTLLFLPILGGVLFLLYQQRLLQQQLIAMETQNLQLANSLTEQSAQMLTLRQALDDIPESTPADDTAIRAVEAQLSNELAVLGQQLSNLENQQATLQNQQSTLQNSQTTSAVVTGNDWKVFEAEYLIGMANLKLTLEADVQSAVVLMESADAALLASGSESVFGVRQSLANELAQLRAVEGVDYQSLYLRVENLGSQLESLEMINSMRQNFEGRDIAAPSTQINGAENAGWLDSSLTFLGSVFVWRKLEDPAAAMMTPGQENRLQQNLGLMFEQAQLALLRRDDGLFKQSLTRSAQWIGDYTVTDTSSGQDLIAELNELVSVDIDPTLPSVVESLELVRILNASVR